MPVVNIFNGLFCRGDEIAAKISEKMGVRLIDDDALIGKAAAGSSLSADKFRTAMLGKESIFNKFSHEKERCVALLRLAMSEILMESDDFVYQGFGAHLVPRGIPHVLDVCIIANQAYRVEQAGRSKGLSEREALSMIHKQDGLAIGWVEYLTGKEAWAAELYDILIPMDKSDLDRVVGLILANINSDPLKVTQASHMAVEDFELLGKVEVALTKAGHNTRDLVISTKNGKATVGINKPVLRLSKLESDLEKLVSAVDGVSEVKVEPGPDYYQATVYHRANFEMPSKILLVDDEYEFVQTLSERLMLRDIGAAVVHDGEQALKVVAEDEPEVMVLDLKMPGIDGIEVLRRIKKDHPAIEVIILTGHGSERDREKCMELGAFAYLEKPVDVEELSKTMKAAYERIQQERG